MRVIRNILTFVVAAAGCFATPVWAGSSGKFGYAEALYAPSIQVDGNDGNGWRLRLNGSIKPRAIYVTGELRSFEVNDNAGRQLTDQFYAFGVGARTPLSDTMHVYGALELLTKRLDAGADSGGRFRIGLRYSMTSNIDLSAAFGAENASGPSLSWIEASAFWRLPGQPVAFGITGQAGDDLDFLGLAIRFGF